MFLTNSIVLVINKNSVCYSYFVTFHLISFHIIGLLLKLVKYDLEKKHSCLIFCNQTKTVQFLQQFFRDQRIEILVMHSQMTDTVSLSIV